MFGEEARGLSVALCLVGCYLLHALGHTYEESDVEQWLHAAQRNHHHSLALTTLQTRIV